MEKRNPLSQIRSLLSGALTGGSRFQILVDAMHGVTGPYVSTIFVDRLGAPASSCLRTVPKTDFGGP
jgi:phosphoglucomutase